MSKRNLAIGVIDSGVGGLTSVATIKKILPKENIIYCGDNGNAPYGNRSGQEIVQLTSRIFDFLQKKEVKVVAVACNTISSTLNSDEFNHYEKNFGFEAISVIAPVVEDVLKKNYEQVGVVATAFTIKTGRYQQLIQNRNKNIQVYGEPSRKLAELIEQGDLQGSAIKDEVQSLVRNLLTAHPHLKEIILGCTHYPIVQSQFEAAAPGVQFINPALDQALAVQKYLEDNHLITDCNQGEMQIYTSGEEPIYHTVLDELGLSKDLPVHLKTF